MSSIDIGQEALLAMGAGSDTTALALTSVMYFLLRDPGVYSRLRKELDAGAGHGASYDQGLEHDRLSELPYLQAVVNEALRLLPVIPNGIPRTSSQAQGPVEVAG
jgi:cytochrome P450